jgi:hypothetical protein
VADYEGGDVFAGSRGHSVIYPSPVRKEGTSFTAFGPIGGDPFFNSRLWKVYTQKVVCGRTNPSQIHRFLPFSDPSLADWWLRNCRTIAALMSLETASNQSIRQCACPPYPLALMSVCSATILCDSALAAL